MRLRVKDVAGIAGADLDLTGIALCGGDNGAGKSSLAQVVAAAVLGQHAIRGISTKAGAAALVRKGAQEGILRLDYGDKASTRIQYPTCEVVQVGGPACPPATHLGIGAARWLDLPLRVRLEELADRADAEPTLGDVRAWLGQAGAGAEFNDKDLEELLVDIGRDGWKAALARAKSLRSEAQGAWTALTKKKFGTKIVNEWRAEGLDPDEKYEPAAVSAAAAQARQDLEKARAKVAFDAGKMATLADTADGLAEKEAAFRAAEVKQQAAEDWREAALKEHRAAAQRALPDIEGLPVCPHCQRAIIIQATDRLPEPKIEFVLSAPQVVETDELKAAATALREADDAVATSRHDCQVARQIYSEAARAQAALDAAKMTGGSVSQEEVDRLQAEAQRLTVLEAALTLQANVDVLAGQWRRREWLCRLLDEETGVRPAVFRARLDDINHRIEELVVLARWQDMAIRVEEDGSITGNGQPEGLLSESERWRVDFIMARLLGDLERSNVQIVDRLDVLVPARRAGVFLVLAAKKVNALVLMATGDPKNLPQVDAPLAGLGVPARRWWMEKGNLSALPAPAQQ